MLLSLCTQCTVTIHSDNNICHSYIGNLLAILKTYYKENFFLRHHQHQVSLQGKHFPIHLDEARSVGLAKACVIQKIYSVPEKIS